MPSSLSAAASIPPEHAPAPAATTRVSGGPRVTHSSLCHEPRSCSSHLPQAQSPSWHGAAQSGVHRGARAGGGLRGRPQSGGAGKGRGSALVSFAEQSGLGAGASLPPPQEALRARHSGDGSMIGLPYRARAPGPAEHSRAVRPRAARWEVAWPSGESTGVPGGDLASSPCSAA